MSAILRFVFSSRHIKTIIMQTVAWQRVRVNRASPCSGIVSLYRTNRLATLISKILVALRSTVYSLRETDIFSLCKPASNSYGLQSFMYFACKT